MLRELQISRKIAVLPDLSWLLTKIRVLHLRPISKPPIGSKAITLHILRTMWRGLKQSKRIGGRRICRSLAPMAYASIGNRASQEGASRLGWRWVPSATTKDPTRSSTKSTKRAWSTNGRPMSTSLSSSRTNPQIKVFITIIVHTRDRIIIINNLTSNRSVRMTWIWNMTDSVWGVPNLWRC